MAETASPSDAQVSSKPIECTQNQLVTRHPELFRNTPADIAAVTPKPLAEIPTDIEAAKEYLDQFPHLIGADMVTKDGIPRTTFVSGEGFQIPTGRVIAANGYPDGDMRKPTWAGRAGGYGGAGGMSSLGKIIEYAQRGKYEHRENSAEEKIVAEVLYSPSGEPLYFLDGGNHRGSASKLRGDETLTVKYIKVPNNAADATIGRDQYDALIGVESAKPLPGQVEQNKSEPPSLDTRINTAINEKISFGGTVRFDRGKGLETAELVDALPHRVRDDKGNTIEQYPIIIIKGATGQQETIRARDFLKWADSTMPEEVQKLREEVLQEEPAQTQEEQSASKEVAVRRTIGHRVLDKLSRKAS